MLNRLLATTKILVLTISEIWHLMKQSYYYPKLLEEQLIFKIVAETTKVMTMRMTKRKKMRMKEVTKMKRMRTKKMKRSIHHSRMYQMDRTTTWIKLSMNKRK